MNTTHSPAIDAVEQIVNSLMKLADNFVLHRVGWETLPGHVSEAAAERAEDYAFEAERNLRDAITSVLAAKQEEVDKVTEHLQFVERWANHHGQKPHTTPQEALSCIQHYPPILAITRGYADGKVPETHNPYAECEKLRAALAQKAVSEVMLTEFNIAGNGANLRLEGGACRLLADAFADQFREHGGENFVEVGFTTHDGLRLIVTMQKVEGKTPAQLLNECKTELATARAALSPIQGT